MHKNDVEKKVAEAVLNVTGIKEISFENSLKSDLNFDSFSLVFLIIEIEKIFDIEFDASDLDPENLIVLRDLVKLVEKYI